MNKEPQLALPFTVLMLVWLVLKDEGLLHSACCLQSPGEPRRSQVQPAVGAGPRETEPMESSWHGWTRGSPQHREATGVSARCRKPRFKAQLCLFLCGLRQVTSPL